jgi:opacity protein-like surface antigen
MLRRRSLALALTTAAAIAVSAPAAEAVTNTTLTFGAGTVQVQDQGAAFNTVRFTIRATNPATTRVFVDIHGLGHSRIALGTPAALGVAHAVYNDVSTDGCQVYTGTTFGEADEIPTTDGSTMFDIRKDELAPDVAIAMEDSTGGAADCRGFDGTSLGRPLSFATAGQSITGLEWQAPAEATGLVAIAGPRAITLAWRPPADNLGVRYQVLEDNPDGSQSIVSESVSGSAATIQSLTPGVAHTYRIWAYRFWGGRMFAPAPTAVATGAAVEFAPPVVPGSGGTGTLPKQVVSPKKATSRKAARPAAPRSWKAKVTRGRVLLALPKLGKGQRVEIMRATKAKYGRIATTTRRSYLDRKVKRGKSYRYRLVLVGANGARSLPSNTITVRVPRR